MSPLVGIFVITLLSSMLYNKFDGNSQTATTRKNPYYSFEKSHAKSGEKKGSKDGENPEFLDENQDSFVFENVSEMDVCIFTVSGAKHAHLFNSQNMLTLLIDPC